MILDKNKVLEIFENEKTGLKHGEILEELKQQIKPVDFMLIAFPEIKKVREYVKELKKKQKAEPDNEAIEKELFKNIGKLSKKRLKREHYLIISIEALIEIAVSNDFSLCKNNAFVYLYNGQYWDVVDKETFEKFLSEAAELMGVNKFMARYFRFSDDLYKQFMSSTYLPMPEIDSDTVLINLLNGTFEINKTGHVLRPFDSKDFLTYQLPFEYKPNAKAPIFQKFLDRVLPDETLQKILAEFLGFVFIRNDSKRLKEEKALILYGSGANGKSVVYEVVSALLGENNISTYSLDSLTSDKNYSRAKLSNKLLNYGSEINTKLESSIFKQLASGEPLEARLPYKEPFIMKRYAKLMFNANVLPKDVEHTNAFFRRFLIIPFNVTILPKEQDKTLHSKIIEKELPGVFNWVLLGLDRLLEQKGFTYSEASTKAVEDYKTQADTVKMFLNENNYVKDIESSIQIKDLYPEYRSYCGEGGFKPLNKMHFKKRLIAIGVIVEQDNHRYNIARLIIEANKDSEQMPF